MRGGGVAAGETLSGDAPRVRRLVFVTRQHLLGEALGVLLAAQGSWRVHVVGEDHPDLLDACGAVDPDILVLDIGSSVVPQLDLVVTFVEALPRAAVVVLDETSHRFVEAVGRGARGCLTYSASIDELREAVEEVAKGHTHVPVADLSQVIHDLGEGHDDPQTGLSPRELQVLRGLAAGESAETIAADLGISLATTRKHTQNILRKLGVHSKLQAAAYAVKTGLV